VKTRVRFKKVHLEDLQLRGPKQFSIDLLGQPLLFEIALEAIDRAVWPCHVLKLVYMLKV